MFRRRNRQIADTPTVLALTREVARLATRQLDFHDPRAVRVVTRLAQWKITMSPLKTSDSLPLSHRMGSSSFPALRLTETHDHLTLVALVPGFSEADLSITLSKDVLRVAGRCSGAAPRDFHALHGGRRATDFDTEIKLLSDVAWSDTEAQLERGVLTIRLRKDLPAARSPIPIRLT
jgi:HSP20 family molecular chaperone IbpA